MNVPLLSDFQNLQSEVAPRIRLTPILRLSDSPDVRIKLELLQLGGSFKIRGALAQALALDSKTLKRGLVAVSGGNHGIAVSLVAQLLGCPATIYMDKSASDFRVRKCREAGATVRLEETREAAFTAATSAAAQASGPTFLHPFDHPRTLLATGAFGLEILSQAPDAQAIVLPIGGGGLIAGAAAAIKLNKPEIRIYGVQSNRADAMKRAVASGRQERNAGASEIAFSLCPPMIGQLTLEYCRKFVDEIVTVDDTEIAGAMKHLFVETGMLVEGAGAATLAALRGPLRDRLKNLSTVAIISGSNVSPEEWRASVGADGT